MSDQVSPELRVIENEIDNYYKSNLLLRFPFAEAVWYLLAFYEDQQEITKLNNPSLSNHQLDAMVDNLVVELNYSIRWLKIGCNPNGNITKYMNKEIYSACHEFSLLALNYISFDAAFTYASRGLISLDIQENIISPSKKFSEDSRFEAYGRLKNPIKFQENYKLFSLIQIIENSVTLNKSKDDFKYICGKNMINLCIKSIPQVYEDVFHLPDYWKFTNYTLGEFKGMAKFLIARSFIHIIARNMAAKKGCKGLRLLNSLLIYQKERLIYETAIYSNVSFNIASIFIDDITYGNRNIKNPDPALQPLIKVNENEYILMPSLIISSSFERNFIVLLNRIPSERKIYLNLVQEKESILRKEIIDKTISKSFRHEHGCLDRELNLPDLDLVLINDDEKIAIVSELKWFIEPSEPREVIEKSDEIMKGVKQLISIKNCYQESPKILHKFLNIDDTYSVSFIVISANFIGFDFAQNPEIPVIFVDDFIKNIVKSEKLEDFLDWLTSREYLPKEGIDYELNNNFSQIGKWKLDWYSIKPLKS